MDYKVEIGSKVKLQKLSNGSVEEYTIGKTYYKTHSIGFWWDENDSFEFAGSDSDLSKGIIGSEAPLAKALLGKSEGITIRLNTRNQPEYKILSIVPPPKHKAKKESNKAKILKLINKRGIRKLIHFTRLENLDSILDIGIIPRNELKKRKIEVNSNDPYRSDHRLDCISLSVTNINNHLLESFAATHRVSEWLVISIDPNILVYSNCYSYFCFTNAANHIISKQLTDSIFTNELAKCEYFEAMFNPVIEYTTSSGIPRTFYRRTQKKNETTDDQAEIMYKGIILPDDIIDIHKIIIPFEKNK